MTLMVDAVLIWFSWVPSTIWLYCLNMATKLNFGQSGQSGPGFSVRNGNVSVSGHVRAIVVVAAKGGLGYNFESYIIIVMIMINREFADYSSVAWVTSGTLRSGAWPAANVVAVVTECVFTCEHSYASIWIIIGLSCRHCLTVMDTGRPFHLAHCRH